MIRWRVWMTFYERPDRPDNEEMWRRKFPVDVVARTQLDAFEEARKIALGSYDMKKYSVTVLNGEYRGLAAR